MKKFFVSLLGLTLMGCVETQQPLTFDGSVEINRTNGVVTSIEVKFPGSSMNSTTIQSRENLDRLVEHLEGMLSDIKNSRDNFPVLEKPEKEILTR